MARHPRFQRAPSDFKPGTIAPWPADKPTSETVASRVRYVPSGEHKNHPSPDGKWTFKRVAGKAKCDAYPDSEWPKIVEALRSAILAPCVSQQFRGDFPARAWGFVNEVLHEARLSNHQAGQYHAFPVECPEQYPDDPGDLLRNAPHVQIPVH